MRRELNPAMIGSVLLHVTIAVALMVSWRMSRDLKVGSVVPVNIVSSAPSADLRPAVQAPEPETAAAEAPVPDAPLESVPPAPEPTPAPPTAKAVPAKPVEKQAALKPQPQPKAEKGLDLDALSASVSKMIRPAAARPSSAPKGAARPETAAQARQTVGAGLSAMAINGLKDEVQRRWNPNCDVEGGRDVQLLVTFDLSAGGQVVGDVKYQISSTQNAVSRAAAERAVRAVYAAAPFRSLPRDFHGDRVNMKFQAREACSS